MPKKGGKRKKRRTHELPPPDGAPVEDNQEKIPRTVVAKIGKVDKNVAELVQELRKVMGPYTAMNLRERTFNKLKDYTQVAGILNLSHVLGITQTTSNIILRVCKFPNGPTLYFKILQYSLCKHIKFTQKHPFESSATLKTSPLVILNNFGLTEESHVKLMGVTLQNLFPSINVKKIVLSQCRRVVLFHYIKSEDIIEMRHYAIRATPVGVNRTIKKVLQSKAPNLGNLEDVSEYLEGGGGAASDSEAEDEASRVVLPDRYVGRGNAKSQQSSLKLIELGPRLTLSPLKIEKDIGAGEVLYHKYESKTTAESAALRTRKEGEKRLKEQRRSVQEANVKRKRELLEAKKEERERKRRRREGGGEEEGDGEVSEGDEGEEEEKGETEDEGEEIG